jgi:RNA polymerase sigma factor (TIGR02999 family)
MQRPQSASVTRLLVEWRRGDQESLNELLPLVHSELRRIARRFMRMESPDHTLQTTALVNEAYLRLVDKSQVNWQNRLHFFSLAARLMRHILIDHARGSRRQKRGGEGVCHLPLNEELVFSPARSGALIALDEALNRLAEFDSRKARVVELRYFGGMSVEETAQLLQVSENTVIRDWSLAKVWLKREVKEAGVDAG